jgi:hypothetical protein
VVHYLDFKRIAMILVPGIHRISLYEDRAISAFSSRLVANCESLQMKSPLGVTEAFRNVNAI